MLFVEFECGHFESVRGKFHKLAFKLQFVHQMKNSRGCFICLECTHVFIFFRKSEGGGGGGEGRIMHSK